MKVRIFKPSKTAMQSGRARTTAWVLEPDQATPRRPEPLMGWTAAADTATTQARLTFASAEEAVAFAEAKGWSYELRTPAAHRVTPRSYADNFRADRPRV